MVSESSAGISRFMQVNPMLYRGARPSETGWATLKEKGIRSAISLEEATGRIEAQRSSAKKVGINFYSLPIDLYEAPSDEKVLTFLGIVRDPTQQPVFVYDDEGKDRMAALIAVYRVMDEGWGPKEAYKEAKKLGFWPYRGDAAHKRFIHQLKDKRDIFSQGV